MVRSVTVTPAQAILAPGDTLRFSAVVDADPGLSREVVWRSSLPEVVTISPSGLAAATVCGADALAVIEAVALADTTRRGTANAGRHPRLSSQFPIITAIEDAAGTPAPLANLGGTVAVFVAVALGGCPSPVDSVRLRITGGGIDTTPAPRSTMAAGTVLRLEWRTAMTEGGTPVFPNGGYALTPSGRGPLGWTVQNAAVPVVLANP